MDKLVKILGHEFFTAGWRIFIMIVMVIAGWTWNRQIGRIDAHEKEIKELQQCMIAKFVSKDELNELKADVKSIQKTLNVQLPEIARFMGQATEYMRTDGGRR